MRIKLIIRMVGISLLLESLLMFVSAIVAAVYGHDASMIPLLFSSLIVGIFGAFPQIFVRFEAFSKHRITSREGYYIVVGSWLLACLFGMIPYLMYGGEFTPINALFESVSGFTTTGASILNDIESLPRGLLFWRMATSWMGGIGIVALFSLVLPSGSGAVLTGVEVSGIARDDASTREKSLVKMMVSTYMGLSLLFFVSYKFCGMGWFDAITHAMSTVSTCGFSTKNASMAAFNSPLIEMLASLFMVLSSISFCLIYSIFTRDKQKNMFQSEVSRTYLLVLACCIFLVTANLFFSGTFSSFGECLRRAVFHVIAFVTTTGFATTDCNLWPSMSIIILMVCGTVCGCSGSTSGGMKFDRMLVGIKAVKSKLAGVANPNQISVVKVDGRPISEHRVSETKTFMILYFSVLVVGALVFSAFGLDVTTSCTASMACIGNVGPGFGDVGTVCNYSFMPSFLKFFSTILMLLGRLELFSLFYVLGIRPRR